VLHSLSHSGRFESTDVNYVYYDGSNDGVVYEETAVTVGYSCRLLSSSDTIETYIVDAVSVDSVRAQLTAARDHLCRLLMAGQLVLDGLELAPWMTHVMAAKCIGRSLTQSAEAAHGCCALVVNGHSMVLDRHVHCRGRFPAELGSASLLRFSSSACSRVA